MTIILFLVDTSASMCQRAHVNGVQKTYLDIAKGAVETFLKIRQRSQDCMGDRYMLLTFEDPPCNVKAGWKENHSTFMNELKNLQSNGLTSMGEALKNAFDLLNLNRMQSGIDTYGQGRCPFYLEPSVIIVLTDGGKYSFRNGVHQEIILPLHAQIPGTKLTKEPFRWDQRLFSLVLRMSGNRIDERGDGKVPHDDSMIEKMCEVTGGRSYRIKSHYVLNQCIESLVQKVQPGVVIHFDQLIAQPQIAVGSKDGKEPDSVADLSFQSIKRMIYVQKHPSQKTFPVGFWPIPEPYWPDPKSPTLPPRDAHPKIKLITPCCDEPQLVRNFPIDKYELEASLLTLQILSKKETNKIWPLIVSNGMHGIEMPFGYLKPSSTLTVVHLYVLPYNYQTLLPLINDLCHKYSMNPPNDWIYKFTSYVKAIPQYYCPFLRRALCNTNAPYQLLQYILPENLDSYLSPTVANYLKQMKNTAKLDQENLCLRVFKQLKQTKPPYHQLETVKLNCGLQMKRDLVTHPMLKDTFNKLHSDINIYDNYTIIIPTIMRTSSTKNYRNPFDIPRRDLIDEIARMRENFFKLPTHGINLYTKDAGHCLPIAEMGNYQEYLKNKETPLRELEPTNVRQHMFGNPYKKDKHMVMVDEADLGDVAPMKSSASGSNLQHAQNQMSKKLIEQAGVRMSRKRKAGPIRKDYIFKRLSSGSLCSDLSSINSDGPRNMLDFSSDDETSSETSSIISDPDIDDDHDDRLIVDFDHFNEPEELPMNGHVQDFINGDDSPCSMTSDPEVEPIAIVEPEEINIHIPEVNLVIEPPVIPPPVIVAPSIITLPPTHANDMNDVLEISKILQQCHNGGSMHHNNQEEVHPTEREVIKEEEERVSNTNGDQIHEYRFKIDENINEINHQHTRQNGEDVEDDLEKAYLDEEEKENIKQHNLETRTIVFKDIRKPGRDYSMLLEHLNLIQGNFDTKFNFVQMCISESMRFRRKKMADSIQEWWEKQLDLDHCNTNDHHSNSLNRG